MSDKYIEPSVENAQRIFDSMVEAEPYYIAEKYGKMLIQHMALEDIFKEIERRVYEE